MIKYINAFPFTLAVIDMKPLKASSSMNLCFRCGYCCRHYDVSYSSHLVEEAQRFDVPVKGPCSHLVDSGDNTACDIYFTGKPSFCSAGPAFENSWEDLEEKLDEGREEFPACVEYLINIRRYPKLITILK